MSRISPRPMTVADMERVMKEPPEELIAAGKQAAAEWVAHRRRKKTTRGKRHAPAR